ncbi:CheR family methyltransferase [Planktothricoides raciborskii]|uniref:protein-glutamate O-methyltransferase n=1 Tax=Planktothricoides raciborskii FACHB-1370 TaxID=2949576 RepID=A0ABR8EN96_9CYAN|nr:protein-glutamate O-methyltransferase CheR [Planktothricoides raciborskii]MBD2547365.1 tetratricopeptide repeat protein [Planktothricoides raciborskii FACHB-1370]MBD2585914.1 tetratricopeptide repeat protein [Planktothricoides raciborskii FACHB-1261]
MNQFLIEHFVKIIAHNTGLFIRPQDWHTLHRKLLVRVNALKLSSLEEYYQLLSKDTYQNRIQLQLSSPFSYPLKPAMDNGDNGLSSEMGGQKEWKELLQLLTTGESYFFRDSGQFLLLKNIILPELIAEQRKVWQQQGKDRPTLRIWSAGCSTGEEPYSLAILLTEIIPDWQFWHLHIVGTDINSDSIKKAKKGLYGSWSFRTVDEQKKNSYFIPGKSGWQIKDSIKQLVKFEYGNLVKDNFPDFSADIANIDLIVCRNVFVYFEAEAIAHVLRKFYQTLRPGGYLFTAHAELYGQQLDGFSTKVFPESVVYQRPLVSDFVDTHPGHTGELQLPHKGQIAVDLPNGRSADFSNSLSSSYLHPTHHPKAHNSRLKHHLINPKLDANMTPIASGSPHDSLSLSIVPPIAEPLELGALESEVSLSSAETSVDVKLEELNLLFKTHQYSEVIKIAKKIISVDPNNCEAYYLLAKTFANLGNYLEAEKYCHQAIKLNYNWIEPYYLMAGIAEEKGDVDTAKSILRKIIYLFPSSIDAYLQIAELYEKEGDFTRAKKMRINVIFLLEKMPINTWIGREDDQIKVEDLLKYMKKILVD